MTPKGGSALHKRRAARRDPRELILIVCCGEKTEPLYFRAMKSDLDLSSVTVEACSGKKGDAKHVVDHAKSLLKARRNDSFKDRYDQAYCIIDIENPADSTLSEAVRLTKRTNIRLILSNPCFEFWFLLHYEMTTGHLDNCAAVETKLKKCIPAYQKNDPNTYGAIKDKTEKAIENAKKVLDFHENPEDLINSNPSTNVHLLVEKLLKMAEEAAR